MASKKATAKKKAATTAKKPVRAKAKAKEEPAKAAPSTAKRAKTPSAKPKKATLSTSKTKAPAKAVKAKGKTPATKPRAAKPTSRPKAAAAPKSTKQATKPIAQEPSARGKSKSASKGGSSVPLFDRLSAWMSLFGKRTDVRFAERPQFAAPEATDREVPPELAGVAARTSFVKMAYTLPDPRPAPQRGDPDGYLFLSLAAFPTNVYLDVPKKGEFDSALELDCDYYGSGKAAFYVASAKPPFVVWDTEDGIVFPSLEAYLTAGARLAFCDSMRGGSWQKNPKAQHPLLDRSMSKSTPLSVLRSALVAKGTSEELAAALVDWLGPDCVLLLEK